MAQLKVSLENIIPLTEARDHFSQIVTEVQRDKLYVLTKGGKPVVAIIDVKYLEAISDGSVNTSRIEQEIQKDPTKVGRTPMIKNDNNNLQPRPIILDNSDELKTNVPDSSSVRIKFEPSTPRPVEPYKSTNSLTDQPKPATPVYQPMPNQNNSPAPMQINNSNPPTEIKPASVLPAPPVIPIRENTPFSSPNKTYSPPTSTTTTNASPKINLAPLSMPSTTKPYSAPAPSTALPSYPAPTPLITPKIEPQTAPNAVPVNNPVPNIIPAPLITPTPPVTPTPNAVPASNPIANTTPVPPVIPTPLVSPIPSSIPTPQPVPNAIPANNPVPNTPPPFSPPLTTTPAPNPTPAAPSISVSTPTPLSSAQPKPVNTPITMQNNPVNPPISSVSAPISTVSGTGLTMKPSIPAANSGSTIDVIQAPEDLDMSKSTTESVFSSGQSGATQSASNSNEDLDDMILD